MGEVCLDGNDYTHAQHFLEKALRFYGETPADFDRRRVMATLAQCFTRQGKFRKATKTYMEAYAA